MRNIPKFLLLAGLLAATGAHAAAGFSGWRNIIEIQSHGADGGFVLVLDQNMDNSFCQYWDRGYVDPSLASYKTILTLATSAFVSGKKVQLYTNSCQTIWGTQYTVFDRIQVK